MPEAVKTGRLEAKSGIWIFRWPHPVGMMLPSRVMKDASVGGCSTRLREDRMPDIDEMGPVDYLVVEFPEVKVTGQGFELLVDLVDRGIVRILDLVFVRKEPDGSIDEVPLADLIGAGSADLTVFDGAASGMIGPAEVEEVGSVLEPGSTAAILVYENTWAAPLAVAIRRAGGQLVASARIPVQAILAALDAADAAVARPGTT
jgi:Family of unknown function (DUF6325)